EALWLRAGFPKERLQRMGAKENFWSMGDTGPCGPCTEIHYDHGAHIDPKGGGPATDSPRYVEIWNLVFMQYEQSADGSRTPLPRPSIDTGMGLERLAAVKQGVYSNYDTDLFQPIIQRAAELAGVRYGSDEEVDTALRVIADHARASAFLVADGVMPSNVERGYVLRRVMRRAIRFGVKIGLGQPFLFEAADRVVDLMGEAYPELLERRGFISEVIQGEERRFASTLHKGLQLLDEEIEGLGEARRLDGEVVFKLHDTFGFPPDLTRLIAAERDVAIDEAGYHQHMEAQRERGRQGWKGSGEDAVPEVQHELSGEVEPTRFTGYAGDAGRSVVLALVADGRRAESLQAGDKGQVVVRETPFYAESGGQVGDRGALTWPGGRFEVTDTKKGAGDIFYHQGTLVEGALRQGDAVALQVEAGRRDLTRLNHTATHLLHAALREVLGGHVTQKGSLVDPDRLRFDFAHHKAMSAEELRQVEDLVYGEILRNTALTTELKSLEQARADGAMALFGEKYADEVRVVSVPGFSVELCGGTHARRTGDIGLFRITSETGIAAGVRRIEALTGPGALAWTRRRDEAASAAAADLRVPIEGLAEAVQRKADDIKRLERELDALRLELARASSGDLVSQARDMGGVQVIAAEVPGDKNTLKAEADRLRDQLGSGVVVLGSRADGKVLIVAAVTPDLAGKRVHAGKLVGAVAKAVGGGGGGRPDFATAGGRDPDALPAALESVYGLIEA
ncbi:MAG: alanine--tRNA ligase, partial [Alphaproteobacteria bacterium]|nr:alanine--tRNA ligase [Alphaproteobacteria bacterium]